MRKYRLYKIRWDLDGLSAKKVGLPKEVEFVVGEEFDMSENGADLLSDEYGFCVYSFQYDELPSPY